MISISTTESKRTRLIGRCVFALLAVVMIVDTFPWGVLPSDRPKEWVNVGTNAVGITQGQWTMFTPNPSVNLYWLTADVTTPSGEQTDWSSPYWPRVSSWEKFYGFRHMNYFNRIHLPHNRVATDDFADYLSRTVGVEPGSDDKSQVVLYTNGADLIYPPEGGIPKPDEVTWRTFSERVAEAGGRP